MNGTSIWCTIYTPDASLSDQPCRLPWMSDPSSLPIQRVNCSETERQVIATGKPLWGTLLALLHKGEPVLGIIDQPYTKERWVGVKGQPTTLNGLHAPTLLGCAPSYAVLSVQLLLPPISSSDVGTLMSTIKSMHASCWHNQPKPCRQSVGLGRDGLSVKGLSYAMLSISQPMSCGLPAGASLQ